MHCGLEEPKTQAKVFGLFKFRIKFGRSKVGWVLFLSDGCVCVRFDGLEFKFGIVRTLVNAKVIACLGNDTNFENVEDCLQIEKLMIQ